MALETFNTLTNEIALDVPGCPDFLIAKEIKKAAIQFCEESKVYSYTATGVTVVDDNSLLPVLPAETRFSHITNIKVDGKPVYPKSKNDFFSVTDDAKTGRPQYFYEEAGVIYFYPTPNDAYGVKINAVIKPSRNATGIEAHILDDWLEAISQLAIFNLTTMPERTWTDANIAKKAMTIYQQQLSKATKQANLGKTNVARKVKFSW
jgi:hypothetical protein